MAELTQKHNSYRRMRDSVDPEELAAKPQAAAELRQLQRIVDPPKEKSKRKLSLSKTALSNFAGLLKKDKPPALESDGAGGASGAGSGGAGGGGSSPRESVEPGDDASLPGGAQSAPKPPAASGLPPPMPASSSAPAAQSEPAYSAAGSRPLERFVGFGPSATPLDGSVRGDKAASERAADEKPVTESEEKVYAFLEFLIWTWGGLEESFNKIDWNHNGRISNNEFMLALREANFKGDVRFFWSALDKNKNGFIEKKEWMMLQPYIWSGMMKNRIRQRSDDENSTSQQHAGSADSSPANSEDAEGPREAAALLPPLVATSQSTPELRRPQGASGREDAGQQQTSGMAGGATSSSKKSLPPKTVLPPTAFLVFRNADTHHSGEPVFINKGPTSMQALLLQVGGVVSPLIQPVQALITPDLLPVKRLQDIQPGAAYLVKGQEQLDPPPSFLDLYMPHPPMHSHAMEGASAGTSFKAMRHAKDAQAAMREAFPRTAASPLGSLLNSRHTSTMSRIGPSNYTVTPPAGSPPWMSYGISTPVPTKGEIWQPNEKLYRFITYSGLGQLPKHNRFDKWQPLRGANSTAMETMYGTGSMSSPSLQSTYTGQLPFSMSAGGPGDATPVFDPAMSVYSGGFGGSSYDGFASGGFAPTFDGYTTASSLPQLPGMAHGDWSQQPAEADAPAPHAVATGEAAAS